MKARALFGLVLIGSMLLLPAWSGAAERPAFPRTAAAQALGQSSAQWVKDTFASADDAGTHTSAAVDQTRGTIHVSYYDATAKDLRYARYVGAGGNCGTNNRWVCETVDTGGSAADDDVGKYSSIAVDPTTGYPSIAYHDAKNSALKIASYSCGGGSCGWSTAAIELGFPGFSVAGVYASLKIDTAGKAHIAYQTYTFFPGLDSLRYATRASTPGAGNCGVGPADKAWQCSTIESGTGMGRYASLDLRGGTLPSIAYQSYYSPTQSLGELRYAWYNTLGGQNCGEGNWRCDAIDQTASAVVGAYASLQISKAAPYLPQIAYYDLTNSKLKYAHVVTDTTGNCGPTGLGGLQLWRCETIDDVGAIVTGGVALASDTGGQPLVAYFDANDASNGVLKTAEPASRRHLVGGNCGPQTGPNNFFTWQCDVIDAGQAGDGNHVVGQYAALALNGGDLAITAYYDATAGDLQVLCQRVLLYLPLAAKEPGNPEEPSSPGG